MGGFTSFVIFAEMRTGSNHLEESVNLWPGVTCHGEVFNPHFVGHEGREALFGVDRAARDADPLALLAALRTQTEGLGGFRFFHDHDPRVLEAVLPDRTVAKVVLRRDPAESYVSRKIAQATGQWRITHAAHRKSARIRFDPEEFAEMAERLGRFEARVRRALQSTGQAAFALDYGEINTPEVLTGLARFLGVQGVAAQPSPRLKRQNPEPLRDKVENPEDMERAIAALGHARRETDAVAPDLSGLVALDKPGLLYLALPGTAGQVVAEAMAAQGATTAGFTDETLRPWLNRTKRRLVFSLVSHPVARAVRLCAAATGAATGAVPDRATLLAHLAARAQTGLPPEEAPQAAQLERLASEVLPDRILRERDMPEALFGLGIGATVVPPPLPMAAEALDDEVESAVRQLYNRDYRAFGFRRWQAERR